MAARSQFKRAIRLKTLFGGCAIAALSGGVVFAQAASTPGAATPAASATEIEAVVVTASRRAESIREIPTAISAYSGNRLAAEHIETLVDLVTGSPNVQLGVYSTNANVAIRGIGNDFTTAGSDPGVAFHVDGVYLADTGLALSTLLDVSRVEILRGPQGTLFGRNATGGAVNLIPNTPAKQWSYGVDASFGVGPTGDHVAGFVSGPLSSDGKWLGRLAVQQTYNDGSTTNLESSGPRRLDGIADYSGRAQLEWLPTSDFTMRLALNYQKERDSGPALFNVGVPDPSIPLPPQIAAQPTGSESARQTYANQGSKKLDGVGAALITDWSLGGGNLKVTLSADGSRQFTNTDGDGTPVNFTNTLYWQHENQYFAEIIFASDPHARLTYVIGGNFFHENEYQNITVPISFLPAPGVNLIGRLKTDSFAAFAHGQYAFTNGLRLFAGGRITDDTKYINESNNFIGTLTQHHNWLRATYEVGTSYDVTSSVTAYLKYATGYKGGGFSSGSLSPAFNPETDQEIEAGLKGAYLGGALQANLAAFHTAYNNLQVSQTIGVLSEVTNAARATVDGVELETVERLSQDLRLELSGGWLNARFDQFNTSDSARPGLGVLNLAGNLLPQAPHFTASAAAYDDLPVHLPGKLTAGVQVDWKSRVFFSEFNLPVSSQAPVAKVNLTLNYSSPNQRWAVSAYARNVTNETIRNYVLVVSSLLGSVGLADLQPGREVGVSLHYKY